MKLLKISLFFGMILHNTPIFSLLSTIKVIQKKNCNSNQCIKQKWKPICLNKMRPVLNPAGGPSFNVVLSNQDVRLLSNSNALDSKTDAEKISLKGTSPDFVEELANDPNINPISGMPGGMDLFGIRGTFISAISNPLISNDNGLDGNQYF